MIQIVKSKTILKIISIIIISFLFTNCAVIFHKSKLHLSDNEFCIDSLSFRIDGYYYMVKEFKRGTILLDENKANYSNKACGIVPIIFYENGFVRKSEFIYEVKMFRNEKERQNNIQLALEQVEKKILVDSFHVQIENTIWDWGLYKQYNDSILIQSYINVLGDFVLVDWNGIVKNDTTLILTSRNEYDTPSLIDWTSEKKRKSVHKTYKFRKFVSKPDSSNYIMNNRNKFGKK